MHSTLIAARMDLTSSGDATATSLCCWEVGK